MTVAEARRAEALRKRLARPKGCPKCKRKGVVTSGHLWCDRCRNTRPKAWRRARYIPGVKTHTDLADFVLQATEAARQATRKRYRRFDPEDIEDAMSVATLNLLDYWCPKYGTTPEAMPRAVHYAKKRASEYLLGELDRRAVESPLLDGDDVAEGEHPDALLFDRHVIRAPREDTY